MCSSGHFYWLVASMAIEGEAVEGQEKVEGVDNNIKYQISSGENPVKSCSNDIYILRKLIQHQHSNEC